MHWDLGYTDCDFMIYKAAKLVHITHTLFAAVSSCRSLDIKVFMFWLRAISDYPSHVHKWLVGIHCGGSSLLAYFLHAWSVRGSVQPSGLCWAVAGHVDASDWSTHQQNPS